MQKGHLPDSSALLASVFREPGAEKVVSLIDDCEIHSVNLAEAVRKMLKVGATAEEVETILGELDLKVNVALSARDAFEAGKLGFDARMQGLSVRDCICLTVGGRSGQIVVTADRRWSELAGQAKVIQIR